MNSPVQRLQDTGTALRSALATQDWTAIGSLDLQCREAIDEAMLDVADDEETLRTRMTELLDLYRELVNVCQSEQKRLAGELVQLNQAHSGAKVYQLFG
ncbi:flagellar protein FliT [Pseudomonas sp. M30-35]|uniref:flagellar protein FliT n=1 Tax=Pseudomonas sp. M30-35 TaxID=1981174 RepID=UPI000B3D2BDB|nr:flagellar protein FliT [Pseudomonas sp. M30-35]ARU89176.1 flagellar protein FliT [Pseudomonas sp. M30-35]